MKVTVVGNTMRFYDALQRLRGGVKTGLIDPSVGTLPKQAQLLTEDCMKLTPPSNLKQGRDRVGKDVRKIFHPLDAATFRSKSVRAIIEKSNVAGWEAFSRNIKAGPLSNTRAIQPTPSLHIANRDRRGRARKTNFVTLPRQKSSFNKVLGHAQGMVGWARSGWMRAYTALGGMRAPSWVSRHGANGVFIDNTKSGNQSTWSISVYNNTGWGKRGQNSQQIVDIAFRGRITAMETYFKNQMRLAAEKFGKAA